jgi:hypothetical protein
MKALRILACAVLLAIPVAPIAISSAAAQGAPPVQSGKDVPGADALAAARDLIAVISKDTMRQMTGQLTAALWPAIERNLRAKQPNITAGQVADLRSEYERIFLGYMNNAMADAPALYARHFSAAEMREMLAFHQSPTGQKALHVLPQLTVEMFQMVMPKLQQMQGQMLDAFTKVARQRGFDI